MIGQLDLTEGGITRSNESRTLPPAESYNLLQRILKEYDESYTTPSVSTITKLECATLDDGRYQWAHREEHTGCQNRLCIDYVSSSAVADPLSTSSPTTSMSNGDSPKYHMCDCVVDAQSGGKDWRRAYCAWEIVDSQQLVLESGQTIQNPHEDLQQQSLWLQSFVLTRVTSVKHLKGCELRVTLIKRPSRLALRSDRVIGSGSIRLSDFLSPDTEQNFAGDRLVISMTEQKDGCRSISMK
ncbi:hypothetical protein Poli38472_014686 [Pythium oligandrum]|uniref:Uncharacterized protein n=1 Tax=Pythium oligandrum TaxID=41045 RepID=A0A8K1CI32_PYTOL|nr:hypothetical protein Poli38472_014686 [Pythium oligandrum]|eukprot:TMW63981.1 hypothetical protein Poli38472_014686 [Pythium oligandrum]